jgi:hypothetical protein
MDDEISQEGLAALAHARHRRAQERLRRDGAESRPAMQRRIQALAAERSIPPADYAKLMYKRVSTAALIAFCDKHNVSTDWLLCGDLKGLQRMMHDHREKARGRPTQKERIMAKYHALTPEQQRIVDEFAAKLLAEREAKEPEPA